MEAEVKDMWVDALRSGEYQRTTGQLRSGLNTSEFCCLGVLCDVAIKAGAIPGRWDARGILYTTADPNGVEGIQGEYLPQCVLDWSGLLARDSIKYASMNDYGATFDIIADHIEAYTLITHAIMHCMWGSNPDNTERIPEQADKDAAKILMDCKRKLCMEKAKGINWNE